MTVTAIGARISAPSPKPSAIGISPRIVVSVVMRIGRSRTRPASTSASCFDRPSRRRWFTWSMSTMAFLTTIPASMTTPMSTMTLTRCPVARRAATTPTPPSGIENMMMRGCSSDSNCAAITK